MFTDKKLQRYKLSQGFSQLRAVVCFELRKSVDQKVRVYSNMTYWTMDADSCWPSNPCPEKTKCKPLQSNGHVCLKNDLLNGYISECSLGGGTCDKLERCGGAHSTGGCSHILNAVCCFDESYGRDGVWPKYYVYADEQYHWSMFIQFDRNSITGGGSDSVGTFTINGSWNPLSKDINFLKTYPTYTVSYTGQVTADVCTMYSLYDVGGTTGAFNMTICT